MAFPPSHGFMFQPLHEDHYDLSSLPSLPYCPPQLFLGAGGGGESVMKRSMSFSGTADHTITTTTHHEELPDDDLSDDGSQMLGEKKKRLSLEQVKALEKSFELRNKLEPERKMQLAKALGLQPRQVAIWFQNRRARWKTKQLERDYLVLKKQFESLKADNDALQAQNNNLNAELLALKNISDLSDVRIKKETEQGSWSNGSDNSTSDNINLDMSRTPVINSQVSPHRQLISKNLFASSVPTTGMAHDQMIQDESFRSMLNGINEQQQGWAWLDQNLHSH